LRPSKLKRANRASRVRHARRAIEMNVKSLQGKRLLSLKLLYWLRQRLSKRQSWLKAMCQQTRLPLHQLSSRARSASAAAVVVVTAANAVSAVKVLQMMVRQK
jgi:hypothetical protein